MHRGCDSYSARKFDSKVTHQNRRWRYERVEVCLYVSKRRSYRFQGFSRSAGKAEG